jgi:xanthine dehydrogenase molybdenum-binding subunit
MDASTRDLTVVGTSVPIHDVREKATGALRYVNDLKFPNLLHAKLVLSPIAHGRVKAIDLAEAAAVPGVVAIYSHRDAPPIAYNSHKWIEGMAVVKDERLFNDHVRFQGDRVAAVVATSRSAAEAAARLVKVEYEPLPAVVRPEQALRSDSQPLHGESNHLYHKELVCGDPAAKLARAHRVVEDTVETPKIHHAAMETHCCVADTDGSGMVTVYTPCQVIFQVQLIVAEALGIPLHQVRVVKTNIGGSFGGKGQPVLEPVAAFLSRSLGRPVKLLLDRTETMLATRTRHRTVTRVRTGVAEDGSILARDIETLVDTGAYCTNGEAIAMAMGKKTFKLYRVADQAYRADVVYTNSPVGGACRGYGSPQIWAATEINIDHTARALGLDPAAFRLRNLVRPHDRDPQSGVDLGNARIIDCVERGCEAFQWRARRARPRTAGRFARGVGMACCAHGNGYQGAYPDFITVDLEIDHDGCAVLKGAFHDLGCGTVTTMMQIAAEVLAMDPAQVAVPAADTLVSPYDSAGTQASRVTFVCGGAVQKAAEAVREQILDLAAGLLDCPRAEVVLGGGRAWPTAAPDRAVGYGQLAIHAHAKVHVRLGTTLTYESPGNPTSYGAHFAEVEVDRTTGRVRVLDYLAVHDIGRAINLGFVQGQLQGSIQMGLGMALSEELALDGEGRVLNSRLSRYTVANAPEMPPIRVELIEAGEDLGPFGAKSVGEIATVPVAPAIINAVNDALGTDLATLPALPERIIAAIRGAGSAAS